MCFCSRCCCCCCYVVVDAVVVVLVVVAVVVRLAPSRTMNFGPVPSRGRRPRIKGIVVTMRPSWRGDFTACSTTCETCELATQRDSEFGTSRLLELFRLLPLGSSRSLWARRVVSREHPTRNHPRGSEPPRTESPRNHSRRAKLDASLWNLSQSAKRARSSGFHGPCAPRLRQTMQPRRLRELASPRSCWTLGPGASSALEPLPASRDRAILIAIISQSLLPRLKLKTSRP